MQFIQNEINLHPLLKEEDLVKLIYQRVYGPSHILHNIEKAKDYLKLELNNLLKDSYGDIEIGGDLIRVDLNNIKDIDLFFDYLLETAKAKKGTIEEYQNEINILIDYIRENNLKFNVEYIKELAKTNCPVHHSKIYNDEYKPHYRIIDINLYKKLRMKY